MNEKENNRKTSRVQNVRAMKLICALLLLAVLAGAVYFLTGSISAAIVLVIIVLLMTAIETWL